MTGTVTFRKYYSTLDYLDQEENRVYSLYQIGDMLQLSKLVEMLMLPEESKKYDSDDESIYNNMFST